MSINRGGSNSRLHAEHYQRFSAPGLSTSDIVEMTNVDDVPPAGSGDRQRTMRGETFQEPSNKAPLKGRGDEAGEGRRTEGGEITPLRRASERAKRAGEDGGGGRGTPRRGETICGRKWKR